MTRFKLQKSNQLLPFSEITVDVWIFHEQRTEIDIHLTHFYFPENHRTQSQYERHRCTKLVLFEFVNNFLSLFYIAFIIGDMDMLRSQVQTMLIISQAITNFQETVQPLALKYYALKVRKWCVWIRFYLFRKYTLESILTGIWFRGWKRHLEIMFHNSKLI